MELLETIKRVEMSDCDHLSNLSIPAFFDAFMDLATVHGKEMGVSTPELAKHNLFWVVTRSKIRFYRKPIMLEKYNLRTWPIAPELLRSLRFCTFFDENGIIAEGKTEWIMLNKDNFRPSRTTGIYPDRLVFSGDTVLDEPWQKISDDFSSFDKEVLYKVKSTDIDLSNHMNNVAYVRALLSAFTTSQLANADIKQVELNYKSQCFEGDELSIRIKKSEDGFIARFVKENTVAVTVSVICNNNIF